MVEVIPLAKLQNGTKVYSVCGQRFEVSKGYTLKKLVGVGSYGLVCSAVITDLNECVHHRGYVNLLAGSDARTSHDHTSSATVDGTVGDVVLGHSSSVHTTSSSSGVSTGRCVGVTEELYESKLVAIKKIAHVFNNKQSAKCVLREMEILTSVRHVNLIKLHHFLRPPVKETFEDIYLVTDLYDTDLHRIIQSGQKLTEEHYQYFMVQAFRGLNYLHSAGIMHRDLKPSNLLVNADCRLAICDFGLARGDEAHFVRIGSSNAEMHTTAADAPSSTVPVHASCSASGLCEAGTASSATASAGAALTQYVVTRWYRPPEVLGMGSSSYTSAVDVWSLGLILAELIAGRIVLPGTDYISQLVMIVQLLGTPSQEDMEFLSPEARTFILSQPVVPRRGFSELFPAASPDAVDLLSRLLQFHPSKRLTTRQVIEHRYFAKFRDAAAESVAEKPFVWRHGGNITLVELREEFWRLIDANAS